jgi:hypothetical protein
MASGFPYRPPTFVILMAVTMPSIAAPKQEAFVRSTRAVDRATRVIRNVGGDYAIIAATPRRQLAWPTTVPIGRSIGIDAALFSLNSRKPEQRP